MASNMASNNIYTVRGAVMHSTASLAQKLNLSDKDLEELKTFSQVVLAWVALIGAAGLLMLAPNMMKVLNRFVIKRYPHRKWSHGEKQKKVVKTLYYLKQSGLIQMQRNSSGVILNILPKGLKRLAKLIYKPKIITPKSWSGTWWLIAADIPISHKTNADCLRRKLKELGFYPLQRSLWVHPYDPREVLGTIFRELDVGHFATVMEVVNIDVDDREKLKKHFGL